MGWVRLVVLLVLSLRTPSVYARLGLQVRTSQDQPGLTASMAGNQAPAMANSYADHTLDIRCYGARGDGVTDDTAAIQAVVDATAVNGGIVYFPPGRYRATIAAPSTRVWFRGAGASSTCIEAANAGEYAITIDGSGSSIQVVDGLRFAGANRTKGGIYRLCGDKGGTASLWVTNCRFSECDRAFWSLGTFYWRFSMCSFQCCNYDWYIEGLPAMQATSGLIDHCYSWENRIASLRTHAAVWEITMYGGVVERAYGFVVYASGHSDAYPILIDRVHLEGNCSADTVDIDGIPTVPYEFSFAAARDVTLRDLKISSLSVAGGSSILLDDCGIDVNNWRFATDGSTTCSIRVRNGTPWSEHIDGTSLNDVYHESRRVSSAFSRVQLAPGPMTDRLDWQRRNLLARGSMVSDCAVADAGGNVVRLSTSYGAPIWGRCMMIDFSSPNQTRRCGVRLSPNLTITQNKWYVWSLDLRTVAEEGYLTAQWRPPACLTSGNMRAYPDRWTRYWGIARYTERTTSMAEPWLWNAHPTANPTFLAANLQLVEFDDASEAEMFINEAAYCPDVYVPRPTVGEMARTTDDVVTLEQNGQRFSNTGSNGAIALTLPSADIGVEYEFVRVESHPVSIVPQEQDCIRGAGLGKALILDTDGDLVRLGCFKKGIWDMIRVVDPNGMDKPFDFEP